MNDADGQRKIATILAADVAGYSRLMADDDRATVAALNAARAVFRERIETHGGERGHLGDAGPAPGRPEVQHDHLAFKVGEAQRVPTEQGQR